MKKNTIKLLTCFLLAGLMIVSCKDPDPSSSGQPSSNPTPSTPSSVVLPSSPVDKPSSPVVSTPDEDSSTTVDSTTPKEDDTTIDSTTPDQDPEVDMTLGENEELVTYKVNVSEAFSVGTAESDIIKGKFTLVAGTEVRSRTKKWTNPDDPTEVVEYTQSIKMGSKTSQVNVSVPGRGKLYLWVQNGSGSADTQTLALTGPDGEQQIISFVGNSDGSPVVRLEIDIFTAGEYKITRPNSTFDIFNMELLSIVEKADISGFAIADEGKVDFLEGEAFDSSSLALNLVYGNGRLDVLPTDDADVSIDASAYNPNVPGKYTIKVGYKNYTELSYDVVVYDIEDLTLGFDAIEKVANSSAGNGVYYNHSVKEVYDLNEAFDAKGLNTIITAKNGEISKDFLVKSNVSYTGFDSTTAGAKEITVKYEYAETSISETFTVYVVDTAPAKNAEGVYCAMVSPQYEGTIGAVNDGANTFKTVQQALDFFNGHASIKAADQKQITLAAGTYEEKLEIELPNLTIKGAGADKTIIEWDSLYGLTDAGGFTHTTDSTQTVAVRESAVNCKIDGVTISNFYNSQARYDERGLQIERGLALLVQADKFTMTNSSLLGIQDTLEVFYGRQYFENVFISGYTDFIFGTNNTTYFKDCTIHTVDVGKDDSGTNGYLTAFKGCNKGSGDYVQYGAIFDGCSFTGDEGLTTKQSIGRTWDKYAAVAVINSEIGGHISTAAFTTSTNKELRYTSMSGVLPTDETVQFVEYNNTGAGALSAEVAGMKMLTEEEAANYSNFDVIFGLTNGAVSYDSKWDPTSSEVVVDNNIYYYFNGQVGSSGTYYQYTQTLQGSSGTGTLGDMSIDATSGKLAYREANGDTQINAGTKLSLNVEAGDIIEVALYGANAVELNGILATATSYKVYYSEATVAEITCVSNNYLHTVKVLKGYTEADANATFTASEAAKVLETPELEVADKVVSWTAVENAIGYQVYVNDLEVGEVQTATSFTFEETTPGNYYITVKAIATSGYYDSKVSDDVLIQVVEEGVDPTIIAENTKITFGSEGNYATYKELGQITVDGQEPSANGGNNSQIKAGSTLSFKINEGASVNISSYSGYTNYTIGIHGGTQSELITGTSYTLGPVDAACTIDIVTPDGANNYFYYIEIVYPSAFEEIYGTVDTIWYFNGTEGSIENNSYSYTDSVQSATATFKGLTIDATTGKLAYNASGYTQFNNTTKISFENAANAKVTVVAYPGQYKYTIAGVAATADTSVVYVKDAGTVDIVATGGAYIYSISVEYGKTWYFDGTESEYSYTDSVQSATATFKGLTIDATTGKLAYNASGYTQFNNTTKISFDIPEAAYVQVVAYPGQYKYTIAGVAATADTSVVYVDKAGTVDIVATGGAYIYSISYYYAEAPVVEPEKTTIYYYNSNKWTDVCAYIWETDPLVAWPGTKMTAVDGKTNWYSIEIDVTDLTGYKIIFNNANNGNQTGDITIDPSKLYFYGSSIEGCTSFEEAEEASKVVVEIWGIVGSGFEGGDWNNDLIMTENNGIYEATIVVKSSATFKIRKDRAWAVNYGGTLNNGTVTGAQGGADIKISAAGTYLIQFNPTTKIITVTAQ